MSMDFNAKSGQALNVNSLSWVIFDRRSGWRWWFIPVAIILAAYVVYTAVGRFSLMEGAERLGFNEVLDGTAHRPFAYRFFVPKIALVSDRVLATTPVGDFLSDTLALPYKSLVVDPVFEKYRDALPSVVDRATSLWERRDFRRVYLIVVIVMALALASAFLMLCFLAAACGLSRYKILSGLVIYSLILPLTFNNSVFFYDFTEQFFVFSVILLVVFEKWLVALVFIIAMQTNKETAILVPFFIFPVLNVLNGKAGKYFFFVSVSFLLLILVWSRIYFSGLPGAAAEWHLLDNINYWFDLNNWTLLEDNYLIGVPIPRTAFVVVFVTAIVASWRFGHSVWRQSAILASSSMVFLFLMFGAADEFRSMMIALPFVALSIFFGCAAQKRD